MSEIADSHAPSRHARFPWVQAAFCAACVGTAAWLWTRYSFAWQLTPREMSAVRWKFNHDDPWRSHHPLVGRYVRLVGIPGDIWKHPEGSSYLLVHDRSDEGYTMRVCMPESGSFREVAANSFVGRPVFRDECCGCGGDLFVALDCATGRFTRESVVGLFVGGIGLVVFALHLGWWFADRRASTPVLSQPVARRGPSGDDTG